MDPRYTDANHVLKFSRTKLGRQFFFIGLIALAFGALTMGFGGRKDMLFVSYLTIAIGFALCMYEMHRYFHPGKPLLSLAPDGVRFKLDMVKELFVPWHEIKALRRIDVRDVTGRGPFGNSFRGVTALVVSNDYYERHLDPGNFLLRGPGWGNLFIPDQKNNQMQFALHSGVLSATADEIYAAVETRWNAFRDKTQPGIEAA